MISRYHVPFYREIFGIPEFLQDPVLTFGYQGVDRDPGPVSEPLQARLRRFAGSNDKVRRLRNYILGHLKPRMHNDFQYNSFVDILASKGHSSTTLDYFDDRADLRYDMNRPIPESEHKRYGTVIDIGCLEHLFDTAQCLENCFRMVRTGGHFLLHTPVNGYFGHGLHVFNPQGLADCFGANGFKIVYWKYSTTRGRLVRNPAKHRNVIVWIIGKKEEEKPDFVCPQQVVWAENYYPASKLPRISSTAA